MKKCSRCEQTTPLEAFSTTWNRKKTKRVPRSWCKDCRRQYDRERLADPVKREAHRSYQRERNRKFFPTEEGRAFNRAHAKKYYADNPEKVRARDKARRAFPLKGVTCQRCGNAPATRRHHHDYSKPLEVELLCKKCNILADREVRSGEFATVSACKKDGE